MKPTLPFLEIMATQACNFSCTGCSNYSDVAHKGVLSWPQARLQIAPWLDRLNIPDFGIIGGEPLLVPDILDWIYGVRELMPYSQIRFTTNGSLLSRYPNIMRVFLDIGNCVFKITLHHDTAEVDHFIDETKKAYIWQDVIEHGVRRWRTTNDVRLQVNRPTHFIKTYKGGHYREMAPYHSDPGQAFEICCQKTCPLLYQGRIYKCSSNGLLADMLAKFQPPAMDEWQQYLDSGLEADCDDQRLLAFLGHFGRAHSICGMCPSNTHVGSQIPHYNKISFKKLSLSNALIER